MSPSTATALCIVLIAALFIAERDFDSKAVSLSIWIPFAWFFFAASRFPSRWLNPGAPVSVMSDSASGSPLDRAVFTLLIFLALLVLLKRRVHIFRWIQANPWVWAFFIYGALSVLWSDYPLVSIKRLIKATGNLFMALVILTEDDPRQAIGWIMRRLAYVLLPLSVLYIKYYPALGRAYHMGEPMYTGVADQKNALGQTVLFLGIYFFWCLLFRASDRTSQVNSLGRTAVYTIALGMIVWLMVMADSATSLVVSIVAVVLLVLSRSGVMYRRPKNLFQFGVFSILLVIVLETVFDLSGTIIHALGRDSTLTTRVPMWLVLLSMVENPWMGAGYESFWLGPRLASLIEMFGVQNAHNGYLELYLSSGAFGIFLVLFAVAAGMYGLSFSMRYDYPFAVLKLTYLVSILVYNWTEATFFGVNELWTLFLIAVLTPSRATGANGRPDSPTTSTAGRPAFRERGR